MTSPRWLLAWLALGAAALAGCAGPTDAEAGRVPTATTDRPASTSPATPPPSPSEPRPATPPSSPSSSPSVPPVEVSDGRPQRALLSVPELRLHDLVVVPYRGHTDDARGTAIQDAGHLASPYGPQGGVGPGGVGNFQVTGHRTSSTHPFRYLPSLQRGDRVDVEAGGATYTYRIVQTRWTSFRSARSLAEQRAAVPGHPGRTPTRAMITLSTCATIEDHEAGNYWADRFGNPEHRIDKIGVLVATAGS